MPGGMGGEYGPMLHPYAYTDGPHQLQPWANIGSGRSTALSDGSYYAPAYHYDAHSRGQGMNDPGGALMPQINSVLGGGLGGGLNMGNPFAGLPQRALSAPPAPITQAQSLLGAGGGTGNTQLQNMQAMFGPRRPMQPGPRQSPIGIVQMGLGPASAPYKRPGGLLG